MPSPVTMSLRSTPRRGGDGKLMSSMSLCRRVHRPTVEAAHVPEVREDRPHLREIRNLLLLRADRGQSGPEIRELLVRLQFLSFAGKLLLACRREHRRESVEIVFSGAESQLRRLVGELRLE